MTSALTEEQLLERLRIVREKNKSKEIARKARITALIEAEEEKIRKAEARILQLTEERDDAAPQQGGTADALSADA